MGWAEIILNFTVDRSKEGFQVDRKTLFEKADQAISQAFGIAKLSVKVVSEKAGEAAAVTRLMIQKATLEHRVSKKFAEIGSWVYEKSLKENANVDLKDAQIQRLIRGTKKLEGQLARVEASLIQAKGQGTRKTKGNS
jgi:hypothetical protein